MKFKEILNESSKFDQILHKKEFMIFGEMKPQHIKEIEKEIEKLLKSNAKLISISIEKNFIFAEVFFKELEGVDDEDDGVSEIFDCKYEFEKIVRQSLKNIGLNGVTLLSDDELFNSFDKTLNIDFVISGYNKDYIKNLDKKFDYLKDYLENLK